MGCWLWGVGCRLQSVRVQRIPYLAMGPHDTVPSGSSAPWSNCSCTPSNLSLDNLKGRLAARATRNVDKSSAGLTTTISTDWRFTFFSYDTEGRVKKKKVFVPGLGEVTLTYDRDRQGRLTERKTVLNDQGGATF